MNARADIGPHGAEAAGVECDCLLIEEHLTRCPGVPVLALPDEAPVCTYRRRERGTRPDRSNRELAAQEPEKGIGIADTLPPVVGIEPPASAPIVVGPAAVAARGLQDRCTPTTSQAAKGVPDVDRLGSPRADETRADLVALARWWQLRSEARAAGAPEGVHSVDTNRGPREPKPEPLEPPALRFHDYQRARARA